ncbi:MAG TPA: NAD(P)/FAD-dependent oxidoreductase [Xanthobacteraceae bacterium]|nr:NAD(P)/FAD-dependent oxidoreductase [Xanthobacteraceae bacterium]
MTALSRRRFLAASAASAACVGAPAVAAPVKGQVDIAIIGAGAAGIAAARRIASTKARIAFIEASDRVGGRCFTDTSTFGVPFDRGAHWIRMPEANPVTPLAAKSGFDIYPAPPNQRMRIGRRNARAGEMEDYLTALVRANRAIGEAGRGRLDVPCAQVLPKDLAEWQQTVEFVLGPFGCAKDLVDVSAADFARSAEHEGEAFCRQGFGALIAKLADGLPVQLSNPATRIDWSERSYIEIRTAKGRLYASTVIVTVSTGVLSSDKLKFDPELPRRHLDAIEKLRLGSYDHIALELPGNPLGLQRDELVFEKSDSARTAAILANISGTPLCTIEVAGKFGNDLAASGEAAMVSFVLDWLAGLYGVEIRKAVRRIGATRWNYDPWTLGAFSTAVPGGQWARAALAEPVRDRIFFAGEATHETLWGTVGGAWASGERAADLALKRLGFINERPEPKRPASSRPR